MWDKSGSKILTKMEDSCLEQFTATSKKEGITVNLFKRATGNPAGTIDEEHPLSIDLYLSKTDTLGSMKENLVHMLTRSLICQKYQFHFRMREQTLFEDILADEFLALIVTYMVMGKRIGRNNCEKALDAAIQETVQRLEQKKPRAKLLDALCNFSQEYARQIKERKTEILTERERLVADLLTMLPEAVYNEPQ